MQEFTNFWKLCVTRLAGEMDKFQFNTWIPTLTISQKDGNWYLYAPTQFILDLVRDNCLARINRIKDEINVDLPEIQLKVGKGQVKLISLEERQKITAEQNQGSEALDNQTFHLSSQASQEKISQLNMKKVGIEERKRNVNTNYAQTKLKSEYTFENLVEGKSNRLAYNVGLSIADAVGNKSFNPFFVYGSTGLGKTHLAQAIANRVFLKGVHTRIRCVRAEQFVSDYVNHVKTGNMDGFKKQYKNLDLLILDDVQFIAGKEKSMEEFFYVFNDILDAEKQVILTSDSMPADIEKLDKRLVSRFSCGLTVEIEPPELEMRVAILHKKADAVQIRLPDDVAFFIAQSIKSNVRDLEGALNRVKAHISFTRESLSIDLAKTALKDILAISSKQLTVAEIQKVVADYYNVKISDIKGVSRKKKIVRPRQIAMSLAKELTEYSLPYIGEEFGGKDHSTVIHAHKKIRELRQKDFELDQEYNILIKTLNSNY